MSESRKRKKKAGANGTDPAQQEIPDMPEAAAAAEAEPGTAEAPPMAVAELGNTGKGCWKVLADGKRVKLSDEEWRKELARVFSRQQPAS